MKLEDLRFDTKDVRRILKLAVKREKKTFLGRFSGIDTSYNSAATYQDLMRVSEERGLKLDTVKEIVESESYKGPKRLYEDVIENVGCFVYCTLGSFTAIAVGKCLLGGSSESTNLLTFALTSTAFIDLMEYMTLKNYDIRTTLRNDVGTVAGQTLGWTLASLL